MKRWLWLLILVANQANALNVPFQNVPLSRGFTLQASYAFGKFSMIFCFDNATNINSSISWPLKGSIRFSQIPVLLKNKGNFQGFFADSRGTISITNTTNTNLKYSCVFGY